MKQFILCSNLFSKLEKSCFKEAIFILQLAQKCSKNNFKAQKYIFLKKRNVTYTSFMTFGWKKFAILANLLQPFLKRKTLLASFANILFIPNLLGHPVDLVVCCGIVSTLSRSKKKASEKGGAFPLIWSLRRYRRVMSNFTKCHEKKVAGAEMQNRRIVNGIPW